MLVGFSMKSNPNSNCRDCGRLLSKGEGLYTVMDVGVLFLGCSALVCNDCHLIRKSEKEMAERALVGAGYEIVHIPQERDSGWWGGRWHVHHHKGCCTAHSYRESAIQLAYNLHSESPDRTLSPCECSDS